MATPSRLADRLTLLGLVASVVVALASGASLRERARPVDVVTVVAGVVGALAGVGSLLVRRRRDRTTTAHVAPLPPLPRTPPAPRTPSPGPWQLDPPRHVPPPRAD